MKEIYIFCKRYLINKRKSIIFFIIFSMINNLVFIIIPFLTGNFVDKLVNNSSSYFIMNYLIAYTILSLIELILGYTTNRMGIKLQSELAYSLNVDIIKHIHKISLLTLDNLDAAYLTQKTNNDSNTLFVFCLNVLQQVVINIFKFLIAFAYIFYVNAPLALILLLISSIYLISFGLLKKHISRLNYTLKEEQANFFSKLYEQLSNSKFIRLHGIVNFFIKRLDIAFFRILKTVLQYQKINYIFTSIDKLVILLSTLSIFIWGGKSVIERTLTIGQFSIILSYFLIMKAAITFFYQLGQNTQETMVSYIRIQDLLNIKEQSNGKEVLKSINRILIQDLSFSYHNHIIFDHFNAEFTKGKIYAILGNNGTGKSTLINILVGLYMNEYSGDILYNDISIKNIDMINVRRKLIGVSEQEPLLLNDTLKFNFNLTLDDNDGLQQMGKLNNFIKIFDLENFVKSQPDRLNMIVNEKSNNLSGGEKQKISLIRSFIRDIDVLILDEPTSAIDKESKLRLIEYLTSIYSNKIILISTHDKELINLCDVKIIL